MSGPAREATGSWYAPGSIIANTPEGEEVDNTVILTDGTLTTVFSAVPGRRYHITHIHVSNTSATNVRIDVTSPTRAQPLMYSTFAAPQGGGAAEEFNVKLRAQMGDPILVQAFPGVNDARVTITALLKTT